MSAAGIIEACVGVVTIVSMTLAVAYCTRDLWLPGAEPRPPVRLFRRGAKRHE